MLTKNGCCAAAFFGCNSVVFYHRLLLLLTTPKDWMENGKLGEKKRKVEKLNRLYSLKN